MPAQPHRRTAAPLDQAHGLRQRFAGAQALQARFLPLVHNPHVPGTGAVMERLCAALAEQGLRTVVVDAADSASPAHQLATVDLVACIEPLSAQVSYLAAGGLPMHFLDSRATLAAFIEALRGAAVAAQADVVLLHAGALDLRRMFAGQAPRPLLLAGARPDSLTHAYTSMKLLSQRLGALAYDLVVAGDVGQRRARRMGDRLADCADHFLGAALRQVAVVDPQGSAQAPLGADLRGLVADRLADRLAGTAVNPLAAVTAIDAAAPPPPPVRASARRPAPAGHLN
ncbi:MAG TPA: flagellar biosynthesis protein [Aquabacterium sp.]|nr:flagellar biosynthesis protein [Aquabacterium sp.]